ncbi:hypothetical protein ACS0TY_000285 [Phlomoides rotata]
MDHDHQWLINCLNASLDPNEQIRTFFRRLPSNKPHSSPVSIRGLLLASLEDPHMMICTAVSVAVSTIAQYDWPGLNSCPSF